MGLLIVTKFDEYCYEGMKESWLFIELLEIYQRSYKFFLSIQLIK
jgi:hypothetical protein